MSFEKAICPNCGGTLTVDNQNEAAICDYCGTPFITEKAINTYNIENVSNSVINIYSGGTKEDFEIVGGVLKKYYGNELEIDIPESVYEIGELCFANTYIKRVVLPSQIKSIGLAAFENCKNLEKIELPESLETIDSSAFRGCESLKKIRIPSKVKILDFHVFEGCHNLKDVELSEGLIELRASAFAYCAIEDIIIPKSVEQICVSDHFDFGDSFEGCTYLKSITCLNSKSEALLKWMNTSSEPIAVNRRVKIWKDRGLCSYCGGTFKGLIKRRCSKCNKEKNY